MRQKWTNDQKLLYGDTNAAITKMTKPSQSKDKKVKIKLVGEQIETKNTAQVELDNYYKFKRKQERSKRKNEKMKQIDQMVNKCSREELVLLKKIDFLMKQQSMLVSKAKDI